MNQNRIVSDNNVPVPYQVWSILCVNMPKQGGIPCNMVILCPLHADSIGLILDHLCVIETQWINGAIALFTGTVNNHDERDLTTGLSVTNCRLNNDSSNTKVQGSRCLLAITMQEACLTKDKITIQNNNTNTHKK